MLAHTAATELPVTVFVPSDPNGKLELGIQAFIEDRLPGTGASASSAGSSARSYVEVLCAIHTAIQQKLTNN